MKENFWGTRFGFYLTVIGASFGLGNLWRFPYVAAENGGGAFVLLYLLFAFLFGMPILIGELLLGKMTQKNTFSAIREVVSQSSCLEHSPYRKIFLWMAKLAGPLSLLISIFILSYLSVICGWVLKYFMQFLFSTLSSTPIQAKEILTSLQEEGWLQVLLSSVHLLIVLVIMTQEAENGIEKFVGYLSPLFVILLLGLLSYSLSLDEAPQALRYFFYPDFSKLSLSSFIQALGHVFFTMSLGTGIMVTFGGYLSEKSSVPLTGFRVAAADSIMTIVAGLLIFPLIMASGTPLRGADIMFRAVPQFFASLPQGGWYGIGFFTCLYLGGVSASLALLESIAASFRSQVRLTKRKSFWVSGGVCFLMSLFPALSSTLFKHVNLDGKSLLELFDAIVVNGMMSISVFVFVVIISVLASEKKKKENFVLDEYYQGAVFYRPWNFILKYIIPILIFTFVISGLWSYFTSLRV